MRWCFVFCFFSSSSFAADVCTDPVGKDGLPAALATPKQLLKKTMKPGESVEVAGHKVSLVKARMPAFVGSMQGEDLVDGEVVEIKTKKEASLHLPAAVRLGGLRVTFNEAGGKAMAAYEVIVEELGCAEQLTGPALKKGEQKTLWLSTEAVSSIKLFEGDEYASSDYFELYLTSGMSENANRKVVVDDAGQPLVPAWISLRSAEHNGSGNTTGELDAIKINTPGSKFETGAFRVELLKVVHGPRTKLRFKEAYAPSPPVVATLVRITRLR